MELVRSREYVHPEAWLTVCVWPPTVTLADLGGPVFAAAVKLIVPLPDPLVGGSTVSQAALDDAVHPQPAKVVRPKLPGPPDAPISVEGDESEYVHPEAWLIVTGPTVYPYSS